jgi:hypothetical protein
MPRRLETLRNRVKVSFTNEPLMLCQGFRSTSLNPSLRLPIRGFTNTFQTDQIQRERQARSTTMTLKHAARQSNLYFPTEAEIQRELIEAG